MFTFGPLICSNERKIEFAEMLRELTTENEVESQAIAAFFQLMQISAGMFNPEEVESKEPEAQSDDEAGSDAEADTPKKTKAARCKGCKGAVCGSWKPGEQVTLAMHQACHWPAILKIMRSNDDLEKINEIGDQGTFKECEWCKAFLAFDGVKEARSMCKGKLKLPGEECAFKVSDIKGQEEVISELTSRIEAMKCESAGAYNTRQISVLLYGPPGTGKTAIASCVGLEHGLAFIGMSAGDLKSAKTISVLYALAAVCQPCMIFLDECHEIMKEGSGETNTNAGMTDELLIKMNPTKHSIITVCSTYYKDRISPPIMSRFSSELLVGLPSFEAREAIIKNELRKLHAASWLIEPELAKELEWDVQEGYKVLLPKMCASMFSPVKYVKLPPRAASTSALGVVGDAVQGVAQAAASPARLISTGSLAM